MASILQVTVVEVSVEQAWSALRQVDRAHALFAPVLTQGTMEGETRTLTFANGMVVRERVIAVDDEQRRVAYSALDVPGMTYHHASMQVVEAGPARCRFIWITDYLPEEVGSNLRPVIQQGADALKANLERR
jgi:Polyketide cyclase / dehydrase and lipid transport